MSGNDDIGTVLDHARRIMAECMAMRTVLKGYEGEFADALSGYTSEVGHATLGVFRTLISVMDERWDDDDDQGDTPDPVQEGGQ